MHEQIKDGKETPAVKRYLVSIGIVLLILAGPLQAGYVFWASYGFNTINRANLDGTDQRVVADAGYGGASLAVDAVHGQLYWEDWPARVIRAANLDGSGARIVAPISGDVRSITVDPIGGSVFWSENSTSARIMRSKLDGTDVSTVLELPQDNVGGIALNPEEGILYWANPSVNGIFSARLDGTEVTKVVDVEPFHSLGGVALDAKHGSLYYWANFANTADRLWRSNLDGTGVEYLDRRDAILGGVSFDPISDKVYWTGDGCIFRANLDGFGPGIDPELEIDPEIVFQDQDGYFLGSIAVLVPEPSGLLLFVIGCTFVLSRRKWKAA